MALEFRFFISARALRRLLVMTLALGPLTSAHTAPNLGQSTQSASVDVISGDVSRTVVTGTTVSVNVEIVPVGFEFRGALIATASDPADAFSKQIAVTNASGIYTLTLNTSSALAAGTYKGDITITLCRDVFCTVFQSVKSFTVPFTIYSLSPTSSWPGNNLTTLAPWPNVADWAMFQGNPAHTGFVPVKLNPDKFTTRWHQAAPSVNGVNSPLVASTATLGGRLYVSGNDHLYAEREFDGTSIWSSDFSTLPFPSVNPPAVDAGIVYVAAGQQTSTYMFAFKATDGSLVFQSPMASQWENYLAPTVGESGIYTEAGHSGGLYAFGRNGTQRFFSKEAQTSLWTPAVDANGVYSYTPRTLQVVDPVTGTVTASINDPTFTNYLYYIGGSPVLGAAGSVFAANYGISVPSGNGIVNTLLDFAVNTNSIAWQVPGDYPTTPAYVHGSLFVANNDPLQLEVRRESDGQLIWSWLPPQAGDVAFISEVLLTWNLVFVSTNLATYAIDRQSHETVWSYPLVGKLSLSRTGILYVQGAQEISAFNLK